MGLNIIVFRQVPAKPGNFLSPKPMTKSLPMIVCAASYQVWLFEIF